MKEITKKTLVPPGGYFNYVDPDSTQKFSHPHFSQLEIIAKKHRRANNYPIGQNWSAEFEDNVCTNTPTAQSHDRIELTVFQKATALTKTLMRWAAQGMRVVSEEEFNRRIGVCEQCEYFGGKKSIASVMCKKCGCSALKAHLQTENLCPLGKWGAL